MHAAHEFRHERRIGHAVKGLAGHRAGRQAGAAGRGSPALDDRDLLEHHAPRRRIHQERAWTGKATSCKAGITRSRRVNRGAPLLDEFAAARVMLEQITVIEAGPTATCGACLRPARCPPDPSRVSDARSWRNSVRRRASRRASFSGYLRFAYGSADIDILRTAHERMRKELADAWSARTPVP